MLNVFHTFEWYDRGGTFISVACRNNTNRRKNMELSLVCVEKKKTHIKNLFNVPKQLFFSSAGLIFITIFNARERAA